MNTIKKKPNYGNWVSCKFVFIPFVFFLVFCGLILVHLELLKTIQSWGIKNVKMIRTNKMPFIPKILKFPFMIGTMSMIVCEK